MPDKQNKLLNFEDKFPKEDNSTVEVISKNEDGLLEVKKRKLHTSDDLFTIENLKATIQKIDDKVVSLGVFKQHHLEMLKWAEKNGICKTEEEYRAVKLKNEEIMQIKELNERKDKTPEDMVLLTNLKKKHNG